MPLALRTWLNPCLLPSQRQQYWKDIVSPNVMFLQLHLEHFYLLEVKDGVEKVRGGLL